MDIVSFLVQQTTSQGVRYAIRSKVRSGSEQYVIEIGGKRLSISETMRRKLDGFSILSHKWTNEDNVDYQELTIQLLKYSISAITVKDPIIVWVNPYRVTRVSATESKSVFMGPWWGVQLMLHCLDLPDEEIYQTIKSELDIHSLAEVTILHKEYHDKLRKSGGG
jgi:hypothetical protein